MAQPRQISTQTRIEIGEGWNVYLVPPDSVLHPSELSDFQDTALQAHVPGTVASSLRNAGLSPMDRGPLDKLDAWYICSIPFSTGSVGGLDQVHLVFEGLATIADVWLNGKHVLRSENMFLSHKIDVTAALRECNELCIRFSSLDGYLDQHRQRGRWRSKMIDKHQLRWARTTLLGRIPRWNQPIHAVGPWQPISIVIVRTVSIETADIQVSVKDGVGIVRASLTANSLSFNETIIDAQLHIGDYNAALTCKEQENGTFLLQGDLQIPGVALWWPHTHGEPAIYPVSVDLMVGGISVVIDFGCTGFREVSVDTEGGNFAVSMNSEPVFLRGACWTPVDITTLTVEAAAYARPLALAQEAGMNMLRLAGDTYYESTCFYDKCAELGITIWQDFAFALMDYPAQDEQFRESVAAEARQLLDRLQLNPALTVVCGNSDVEMQAAMLGLSPEEWTSPLYYEMLADLTRNARPNLIYLPSSPVGGALPFHVNSGVASYYSIGTYMQPLEDARRCGIRFAAECLAHGNIPEQETIGSYLADGDAPGPYPSWKAGIQREIGVGVDVDDVRDHYTQLILDEDPRRARFYDPERYLALGRVTTGEVMAATFSEWRRPNSTCNGALVWTYRDLSPGAGWGLINSFGRPKSSYYYLKRSLSPIGLFFSDEGASGINLHIVNEGPVDLEADLRIALYRNGSVRIHEQQLPILVSARGATEMSVDGLIGRFFDSAYSYRFGPPTHDVTVAELTASVDKRILARAFHFPAGRQFPRIAETGIEASARDLKNGSYEVMVSSKLFSQAAHIEVRGFTADDNYFHMEPGSEHSVILSPYGATRKSFSGYVEALNNLIPVKIALLQEMPAMEAGQ